MAFDFFTQPTGPVIDTSLYGDAIAKGSATGMATPTKTTAIIQGIEKGISQGMAWINDMQKIREADMDLAIKQNTLDRIPQINEAADVKLQSEKLDLQKKQELTQEEIDSEKAKLEAEALYQQQRKKFFQITQSGDHEAIFQALTSGEMIAIASKDPSMWKAAMDTVQNSPFATKAMRDALNRSGTRKQALTGIQKGIAEYETNVGKYDGELSGSPVATIARTEFGMPGATPSIIANKVVMYPSGYWQTEDDPDGKGTFIKLGEMGEKLTNDKSLVDTSTYQAFSIDTGKLVGPPVDKDEARKWMALHNGAAMKRLSVQDIYRHADSSLTTFRDDHGKGKVADWEDPDAPKPVPTGVPKAKGDFAKKQEAESAEVKELNDARNRDGNLNVAVSVLDSSSAFAEPISSKTKLKLKPQLSTVAEMIKREYRKSGTADPLYDINIDKSSWEWASRVRHPVDTNHQAALDGIKRTIAQQLAYDKYDTYSQEIKDSNYGPEKVQDYMDRMKREMYGFRTPWSTHPMNGARESYTIEEYIANHSAKDGRELYYQQHRYDLENQVEKYMADLRQSVYNSLAPDSRSAGPASKVERSRGRLRNLQSGNGTRSSQVTLG